VWARVFTAIIEGQKLKLDKFFMKIFFVFLTLSFVGSVHADERVEFTPVDQGKGSTVFDETQYQILKNETRINELYDEINELKIQLNKLDLMQNQLMSRINTLLPKEDQFINAHSEENEEEFKYGFDMLTAGHYDRAHRAFKLFIEKYPNDSKIGEAYFWLGEVAYKTKDYKQASKSYLVSYRDYKGNPRRNDALFKLSIVLGFLGKMEEACAGFDILMHDTPSISENLRHKSKNEAVNIGCKN